MEQVLRERMGTPVRELGDAQARRRRVPDSRRGGRRTDPHGHAGARDVDGDHRHVRARSAGVLESPAPDRLIWNGGRVCAGRITLIRGTAQRRSLPLLLPAFLRDARGTEGARRRGSCGRGDRPARLGRARLGTGAGRSVARRVGPPPRRTHGAHGERSWRRSVGRRGGGAASHALRRLFHDRSDGGRCRSPRA